MVETQVLDSYDWSAACLPLATQDSHRLIAVRVLQGFMPTTTPTGGADFLRRSPHSPSRHDRRRVPRGSRTRLRWHRMLGWSGKRARYHIMYGMADRSQLGEKLRRQRILVARIQQLPDLHVT